MHNPGARHNSYNPRRPRKPPTQAGQVGFRIVCHSSMIGGLIGSFISQIRRDTSTVIHCNDPVPGSDHCVIVVLGPASLDRRISLLGGVDEGGEEDGHHELLVSRAQVAVLRIIQRMWEVDTESEKKRASQDHPGEHNDCNISTNSYSGGDQNGVFSGNGVNEAEEGYCGLLADTTQIGAVVGKGGKNVVRMRRESGARITILPAPQWASKDDELIQITGRILAVKKALLAMTGCLQDFPPLDRDRTPAAQPERPVERAHPSPPPTTSTSSSTSDPHSEFFPHLSIFLPSLKDNHVNSSRSPNDASPDTQREVSFRLLCTNGAAGSIIGKKGSIVRGLQSLTGASILFAAPITASGERIVTVSAFENLDSSYSPAQNAIVLVFARSIEYEIERGRPWLLTEACSVTARLLVASEDICCLSRKNGDRVDSEMADMTEADIRILEGDDISDFASHEDTVVQISGKYQSVQKTLFQVTGKLRDSLLAHSVLSEVRPRSPYKRMVDITPALQQSASLSLDLDRKASLVRGMGQLGLSEGDHPSSRQQPQLRLGGHTITGDKGRSTTYGSGSELERSLHFLLPREVLNEVGGRNPSAGIKDTASPEFHSSGLYSNSNKKRTTMLGNNQFGPSKNIGGHPSPHLQLPQITVRRNSTATTDSERGSTTFEGSAEHESGMGRPNLATTTVELMVSENVLGSVCGGDGSNLARLKQISGAKVEVCDPCPGKSERVVVITGTPDQTRAAQSLLQAFILAGQ